MSNYNPIETPSNEAPTAEFIPQAGKDFVVTPYIQDLTDRALAYLNIGYAVHLSGPAGTGKSTLAMHIASQLGQHCTLLHGDDEYKASDLLGRDTGYRRNSMVDNYVSSIVKTEETLSVVWSSNRLTTACQKGHTLIYDEFTRSPATANNPFLSILEEGILNIPSSGKEKGYIKVHPNFRAIFTSNPEEYVGVHKTQDALLDRMITLSLDYQDRETETAIVVAKSRRSQEDAENIVDIIRSIRKLLGGMNGPTVRAAIAIAQITDHRRCKVHSDDEIFQVTCGDVLYYHTARNPANIIDRERVDRIIRSLGKAEEESPIVTVKDTDSELPIYQSQASNGSTPESKSPEASRADSQRGKTFEQSLLEDARALSDSLSNTRVTTSSSPPQPGSSFEQSEYRVDVAPGLAALQSTRSHPSPNNASSATHASESLGSTKLGSSNTGSSNARELSNGFGVIKEGETATPLQMLDAAVSRFPRPPGPSRPAFADTPNTVSNNSLATSGVTPKV